MTPDEQTILRLTREVATLLRKLTEAETELLYVGMACSRADVPNGFEDGNSWDDYSESERVGLLADSYLRLKAERDARIVGVIT
jgi:hypothetical protein